MSKNLEQLLAVSDEVLALVKVKDALLSLTTAAARPELVVLRERFSGPIATTSFRVYEGVIDEFRLFAQCFPDIKNQDLFSQALIEFIDKYSHKWRHPVLLEVGDDLLTLVDKEAGGRVIKFIRDLRSKCETAEGKSLPPVKIKDSDELKKNEYRISVNGTEKIRGNLGSTQVLERRLRKVLIEQMQNEL